MLWWADCQASRWRAMQDLNLKDALLIGAFQALALIPGTSRSGITMTAGLMLGLTRQAAARFSFLMAVPIVIASGSFKGITLVKSSEAIQWEIFALGVAVAFVSAWAVVALFLRFISQVGMLPFVLYRLILGAGLLILFW